MPIRPKYLSAGPFRGMRYIADPRLADPKYCYRAVNMVPTDDGFYQRYFSFGVTDSAISGASQGLFEFDALGSPVAVIGGALYTVGPTGVPAAFVSGATITGAGATLSTTNGVWGIEYNKQLVLHDGANAPFMVSTAGVVTPLTNAPTSVYGNPAVYYAKLFFIKATDRVTIVWSEENAANTGYEAGGFNNAWSLTQSGKGNLYAILGTNEALYYWRQTSLGAIRGAVTPDFTAAGVHDEVSRVRGSVSGSPLVINHVPWFVDQSGVVCRIQGGQVQAFDGDLREFYIDSSVTYAANTYPGVSSGADSECRLGYEPRFGLVVAVIQDVLSRARVVALKADTGEAACEFDWDPGLSVAWGNGAWRLCQGNFFTGSGKRFFAMARASSGNVFIYRQPEPSGTYYAASGTTHQPTTWQVVGPPVGADDEGNWRSDTLTADLDVAGGASAGAVTLQMNTNHQPGSLTTVGAVTVGVQSNRRGYRAVVGPNREARWLQAGITGNDSMGFWAVKRLAVKAYRLPMVPTQT